MSERSERTNKQRVPRSEAPPKAAPRSADVPYRFEPTATTAELHSRYDSLDAGAETDETVTVAGRLMLTKRRQRRQVHTMGERRIDAGGRD